jgi:hypothetical protein
MKRVHVIIIHNRDGILETLAYGSKKKAEEAKARFEQTWREYYEAEDQAGGWTNFADRIKVTLKSTELQRQYRGPNEYKYGRAKQGRAAAQAAKDAKQ